TPETLKLQHGKRSVRLRMREGETVRDVTLHLDDTDSGRKLQEAVASPALMTIHTEEATLEAIFVEMTGRTLEG
ncbi:MAG: ABC transporter ATP-binding protein, partial [Dehalococcoidia bacterium]